MAGGRRRGYSKHPHAFGERLITLRNTLVEKAERRLELLKEAKKLFEEIRASVHEVVEKHHEECGVRVTRPEAITLDLDEEMIADWFDYDTTKHCVADLFEGYQPCNVKDYPYDCPLGMDVKNSLLGGRR